jgi:hypothetical protein
MLVQREPVLHHNTIVESDIGLLFPLEGTYKCLCPQIKQALSSWGRWRQQILAVPEDVPHDEPVVWYHEGRCYDD